MWVGLIILIVLGCFILPEILLPLIGCILGCAVLYILAIILIDKYKSSKPMKRKSNDVKVKEASVVISAVNDKLADSINEESNSIIEESTQNQILVNEFHLKGVWDDERDKIKLGFDLDNILIDGFHQDIEINDELDESEFAAAKLMKSHYPFSWDRLVESETRGNLLLVNFWMPSFDDLPDFVEVEYKREHPVCVSPNEKRVRSVWTDMSYKIVIRSLYELFSSRRLSHIESISFNGIVRSLDLATGNKSEKCILSVIVNRSDFDKLDLSRVDAKQCFKGFKGISAHDLSTLTPIPPIMSMNKTDKRFTDSYDVLSNIESGENIAAMDWRDFENLIRELFEREFSSDMSEVKITRASKDGGVDAVVFDSDPIRGGKIIIQAKRYTNVVGLSAVRDLYGTVLNEGATKGILVTTSDYGADSYNFAKDKPLSLLNGANLLYLLEKHGCKAYINITEAKKLINAKADE